MRGSIKYPERYKQSKLISYEGLERHRKITPTDIDGLIDYNGKAFVYMDAKLANTPIQYGQILAFEHLVDSHCMAGSYSMAMIFEHDCFLDEIIDAKYCKVDTIYYNGIWHKQKLFVTVLDVIKRFENYLFNKGIDI